MTKNLRTKQSSSSYLIYLVSFFAALAGLLFGYDTGVISGAILFIKTDFTLSPTLTEITVSAVLLGALLGSGMSGRLTDYMGRKSVLISTAIIFIIGSLGCAYAPNVIVLIVNRLVLGIAIGIASFTTPLYIAEMAPYQMRGMLVSLNQLAITIGILLSYIIDYTYASDAAWRMMLGIGVIPAAIFLLGLCFLPESPRWMMLRGWNKKAEDTLKKIRHTDDIHQEFSDIKNSLSYEAKTNRVLFQKWLRPILWITIGLGFFQQTTGINTVIYYAPTILKMAGFHDATGAILATLGIGVINVLFTIIALPLIDRWGRRPLLLIGLTGMCLSLFILGFAFHYQQSALLQWIALFSMVFYIACFAMSLGPIMWLMISELYPLQVRGVGSSFAVSASWGFNMLVAVTFLTLIQLVGADLTFLSYAGFCVAGWLFVYFMVPETKHCTLEQIEHNLRLGKRSRDLGLPMPTATPRPAVSIVPSPN